MVNERYNIKLEVITPLSIGMGAENDWAKGADFVIKGGNVYILDLASMVTLGVDISKLSDMLAKGDSGAILKLLGNNVDKVARITFSLPAETDNPIKTTFKNDIYGIPVIPGSSLKGALRSVLFQNLKGPEEKDQKIIFGEMKDGSEFMRFIKVSDFDMPSTSLYNTKLFNLQTDNSGSWVGGWKHQSNRTTSKYTPYGFNTIYECITPSSLGVGNIMLSPLLFKALDSKYIVSNHHQEKQTILSGGIKALFHMVNEHTRAYLLKEKEFFKEYEADKSDIIIDSIDELLSMMPIDDSSCLIKMSAGSGFHSITGDWQYDDYTDTGYDERTGKKKYKSRRIVSVGDSMCLMGFVRLTNISDSECEQIRENLSAKRSEIVTECEKQKNAVIEAKHKEEQQKKERRETSERLIKEALEAEEKGDFNLAIQKSKEAKQLSSSDTRISEIIGRNEFNLTQKNAREAQQALIDIQAKAKKKRVNAGLAALLDEKYTLGPNKGRYKVTSLKVCLQKTDKFMRDAKITELSADQKESLLRTIKRIKAEATNIRLTPELSRYITLEEFEDL